VQGRLADIWEKNIMENLKSGNLSYIIVEEFSKEDDKMIKNSGIEESKTEK